MTTKISIGPKNNWQYSVIPVSNSSYYRNDTAPINGPKRVPIPPKTIIIIKSPDFVQCITAGLTKSVWFADKTPANPQIAPEMTKIRVRHRPHGASFFVGETCCPSCGTKSANTRRTHPQYSLSRNN